MKIKLFNVVIRNVVAYVIIVIMVLTSITILAVAADSEKMYGDIDNSNTVNASDSLLVLQHAAKLSSMNEKQEILADVNGDKMINASDALFILQYAAKLINEFPVENITDTTESFEPEVTEVLPTVSPSEEVKPTSSTDTEIDPTLEPETNLIIAANNVSVSPGDKDIKVVVSVKNNPGILGMTLTIDYDETAMKLKDAVNGEAVSNVLTFTTAKELRDGCNFVWDGQEIFKEDIFDGAIMTLTFDILETASPGAYDINFSYVEGDIIDGDLMPIAFDIKAGSVVVK